MKSTRAYDNTKRARLAGATRDRILDATIEQAFAAPLSALTLPAVAERAGVAVQTVLRNFGSREALIEAAGERGRATIADERRIDPDDLAASLAALIDHYELRGDGVILLLGQEAFEPLAAEITATGRAMHRAWVAAVFARQAAALDPAAQETLIDLLVIATDVYAWKLLRRDRGLSRGDTLARMSALVASVLAAQGRTP